MPNTISPNMNLVIPSVGLEQGPDYATDVNNSLSIVDLHDHTAGRGVQITPAGLNLDSDVTFLGNNATNLRSVRFNSQGSPLSGGSDKGALYESGVDLYYNDGNGNQIRLTASGAPAGTPGSIAGLVSPASATYNAGTGTFIWQSNTNVAANMDNASVTIRIPNVVSSAGTTIAASLSLVTPYTITLPTAPPASLSLVTMDNSGNLGTTRTPTIDSLTVTGNIGTGTLTTSGSITVGTAGAVVTNNGTRLLLANGLQLGSSSGPTITNTTTTTIFSNAIEVGGGSGAVITNDGTATLLTSLRLTTASTGPLLQESPTSGSAQLSGGLQLGGSAGPYIQRNSSSNTSLEIIDSTLTFGRAIMVSFTPASGNGLRIIRGLIANNGTATTTYGEGFTIVRNGTGDVSVNFNTSGPSGDGAAVTCTLSFNGQGNTDYRTINAFNISNAGFRCIASSINNAAGTFTQVDTDFSFVAVTGVA